MAEQEDSHYNHVANLVGKGEIDVALHIEGEGYQCAYTRVLARKEAFPRLVR
jgi:hypothetical protein